MITLKSVIERNRYVEIPLCCHTKCCWHSLWQVELSVCCIWYTGVHNKFLAHCYVKWHYDEYVYGYFLLNFALTCT